MASTSGRCLLRPRHRFSLIDGDVIFDERPRAGSPGLLAPRGRLAAETGNQPPEAQQPESRKLPHLGGSGCGVRISKNGRPS